ncbi:exocyst complex component 7 [Planococcus citri]|uniref:exocyst complex component 7 n=1 Tax=Planococcus citri TaxID=170843 RepID=UPI0031F81E37
MSEVTNLQNVKLILEKEDENLTLFKERFEQSQQITSNMINILEMFENRLSKLEETILPLYSETENLQSCQKNIEKTISALDHVIAYYSVSTEVESIIRAGPNGAEGLDNFLNALDRLKQAQIYFEKNNPQSVELENVSSLFNSGGDALSREFKEMILKHSRAIAPITLLDLIANDEEVTVDDSSSVGSYSHFPENVAGDLIRIANWLMNESRDEYMNVYARIRANVLMKSLNMLKEHQKSGSGGSIQGVAASPTIRPKYQRADSSTSRKPSKRLQNLFEKKANKVVQRVSQTLEYSTGFSLGARRSTIHFGENREDVIDEQEMENYLTIVMAVQKLMQNELSLLSTIIPVQHQHQVFQIIIQDALDAVVQDGENIASRAKRCVNRHDFSTALVIFPILKHLLDMKPDFEKIIESCDFNVRTQFGNVLNKLQNTGSKVLEDFVEHVKSDSNMSLPRDGTVYQLTSDVLFFLEQLLDYIGIIGTVLAQDNIYTNALATITIDPKRGPFDKNKVLLGIYIKKVLSQLNLTLINKSDLYCDVAVKALFRLNNCNHVLKSLQRCSLLELVTLSEPDCEETYFNSITTHKKTYQQCWSRVLSFICDMEDIQVYYGKLKDKEKTTLKERFSGFNKEIEEISKLQRGYSVPDFELREGLKRDNKEYILPKYNLFYDRYAHLPFAKNLEKYVKYTPEQVAAMMDRFFDIAA